MKESTIYEFDPAIYPRKVWVAVTDDTESLKNYFSLKINMLILYINMEKNIFYLKLWRKQQDSNLQAKIAMV